MAIDPPPVLLLPEDQPPAPPALAGWRRRDGFALPPSPWDLSARRWLCLGVVDDEAAAAAAIEALSRGVGLAVALRLRGELRLRTLEDLHRLGSVASRTPAEPVLDDEHRRLLDALAGGATLTDAARDLHLSRRTANRRLAEIRRQLGVASTAEAIARWAPPG